LPEKIKAASWKSYLFKLCFTDIPPAFFHVLGSYIFWGFSTTFTNCHNNLDIQQEHKHN